MNHTTVPTPAGPLTIVVSSAGEIRAAGFTADLGQLPAPAPALRDSVQRRDLGQVSKAIGAYLDGDLAAIDAIPVEPWSGGEFVSAAWRALCTIRPGHPVSYARLAAVAGKPGAVRAAASACARNPVALFVPCHRVLRTGGGLGGYRWGLAVKRWLLDHEEPRG